MSTTPTNAFPQENLLSNIITKIAGGSADADAARLITTAIQQTINTKKKSEVLVKLIFEPQEERGAVVIRPFVTSKIPHLPMPGTQFNMAPTGALMTQLEWMMGGGQDEKERVLPLADGAVRQPVQPLPPAAPQQQPLAPLPAPAPLAKPPEKQPLASVPGQQAPAA